MAFFCVDRNESYDPISLIPNGFTYTYECETEADVQAIPNNPHILNGSTALVYEVGQDVKMFKKFPGGWRGPF